jgi:hypothetical protein
MPITVSVGNTNGGNMKAIVIDSDSANSYDDHGKSYIVVAEVEVTGTSVCYDGGRVELDGYPKTIWVWGNRFRVYFGNDAEDFLTRDDYIRAEDCGYSE